MTNFRTFGLELEIENDWDFNTIRNGLTSNDVYGCDVKPDATAGVGAEIVTPPLAIGENAKTYLQKLCNALQSINCSVNASCGLHVHVSNSYLNENVCAENFTTNSIAHRSSSLRNNSSNDYYSDHQQPLNFLYVKDWMYRYHRQQDIINSMFPVSRTNNHFCKPLIKNTIDAAHNIESLNHGKFYAINCSTWSNGTIEFRQHSGTIEFEKIWHWLMFLENFIKWTDVNRIETGNRTIVHYTPVDPFRRNSRIGVQYRMMRTPDGATTRAIMDATGCSEQRVRAAVSEMRGHEEIDQAAVVTHTQQANGATYGDGTDYTRYQVLESYEKQTNDPVLMPENRIGIPSIWAGMSDYLFEKWQNRIQSLNSNFITIQ